MRVIFVCNPYNAKEKAIIERAKLELGSHVEEVECLDFNLVRDQFKIRTTPALIVIRDDLQGENLLEEDMSNNQLRVTAELLKAMEEEDKNLHQKDTYRIDSLINKEVQNGQDSLLEDLFTREVL